MKKQRDPFFPSSSLGDLFRINLDLLIGHVTHRVLDESLLHRGEVVGIQVGCLYPGPADSSGRVSLPRR